MPRCFIRIRTRSFDSRDLRVNTFSRESDKDRQSPDDSNDSDQRCSTVSFHVDRMAWQKNCNREKCGKCRANRKALSSIMIITISLTVCYDPRNFDRLCYIEDDVVKWFRRLCASPAKRSVTRLNQTVYAKILTRKNFRQLNLSIPVVRYWSGASSSRFRQAKPRAE